MSSNKTKTELEAENRILRRARTKDGIASVLRTLIRWGVVAYCAYEARLMTEALAGQTTDTHLLAEVFLSGGVNKWGAWCVAALCGAWAGTERKLRKTAIKRFSTRSRLLELQIDPRRSTSGLDPVGDTHPDDRE